MKRTTVTYQFVEYIPEPLEEGVLYISMSYATAAHSCCCGCGHEVVTPFSPTDWKLTFDGETVSLSPSIGNWSFPCRSHYWIKRNEIAWAGDMSQQEIEEGRAHDRRAKAWQYGRKIDVEKSNPVEPLTSAEPPPQPPTFWARLKKWWS
jgi:hypothetical protein